MFFLSEKGLNKMDKLAEWIAVKRDIRIYNDIVTKKATLGRQKLLDEIDWLTTIGSQWPEHFPKILATRKYDTYAEYDMPYYKMKNLAEVIIDGSHNRNEILTITNRIFYFLAEHLHFAIKQQVLENYVFKNYIEKIFLRFKAGSSRSDLFDKITNYKELIINGKKIENIYSLIDKLLGNKLFYSLTTPQFIGYFHGDFKPDNILVDFDNDNFILIDPRGKSPSGNLFSDYVEDFSKFRTCTNSFYDLFRSNKYKLTIHNNNICWELSINPDVLITLNQIDQQVLDITKEISTIENDNLYYFRLLFIEAILLIANAPFQIIEANDSSCENRAIVQFCRGLELLNEFYDVLNKD